MGNYQSDLESLSDVETEDDRLSVNSEVTGSFGLDTGELHEQYSSMLAKYHHYGENPNLSRDTATEDLQVNGLLANNNDSQVCSSHPQACTVPLTNFRLLNS